MLEELKWPTLEERRQRARLVLMSKIVNGLVKIDATDTILADNATLTIKCCTK
jgi:hypothetical protein